MVNLQATHVDGKCEVRLWGRVDEVMKAVCERVGVEVEAWQRVPMQPWTYEQEEGEGEAGEEEDNDGDEEYRPKGRGRRKRKGEGEAAVAVRRNPARGKGG